MRVSFAGIERLERAYNPLKIVNKKANCYSIMDRNNEVGSFVFDKQSAEVDNFCIRDNLRRKKISANAILTLRDFVVDEAKKQNISKVYFWASNDFTKNLIKLYEKLGATRMDNNRFTRFVAFLDPNDKTVPKEKLRTLEEMLPTKEDLSDILLEIES